MNSRSLYSIMSLGLLIGGALYYVFGGAYGRVFVQGPSQRFGSASGTCYRLGSPDRKYPVDLKRVMPFLREADWSSDHLVLWKVPYVVELSDGRVMKIDRISGQYTLTGVQGVFSLWGLSKVDHEIFSSELSSILKE